MPAISSGKVLVTGANGYIATWIVKLLLDAGYSVRGTVRAEAKATHLRTLFGSFGDKFEVAVVPDMTKDDAFAPHVADVDAIAHTASPVIFTAGEPADVIGPAVAGTLSVLKTAQAHGTHIKRVIVLSSTAAMGQPSTEPRVLDESSWNETSVAEVREKGRDAGGVQMYRASKTLAERAAWEWYREQVSKAELRWDMTVLCPPFVFGPPLHELGDDPESALNVSLREWYYTVVKGTKRDHDALARDGIPWVDVRDIAQAHLLALQKTAAGGERFIVGADICKWQTVVNAARLFSNNIAAGNTSYDPARAVFLVQYDHQKSVRILDLKYRTLEEMSKDLVEDFQVRGWL